MVLEFTPTKQRGLFAVAIEGGLLVSVSAGVISHVTDMTNVSICHQDTSACCAPMTRGPAVVDASSSRHHVVAALG